MGSVNQDAVNAALQAALAQQHQVWQPPSYLPASNASWAQQLLQQPLMPGFASARAHFMPVPSAAPRVEPTASRQQPRAQHTPQQPAPQQQPQQPPSFTSYSFVPPRQPSTTSSGAQTDPEPQGRPGVTTRDTGSQTKGNDGHWAMSQSGPCLRRA